MVFSPWLGLVCTAVSAGQQVLSWALVCQSSGSSSNVFGKVRFVRAGRHSEHLRGPVG